jgi:uncharacterized protein
MTAYPYTDSQRMELRSFVSLAGEVVAPLWPMRTFISRNPLQGLEDLNFEEAVRRGEHLFSGRGYLSREYYRQAFLKGRIHPGFLDEVLAPLASESFIRLGDRRVSQLEVLRATMVHGLRQPEPGLSPERADPDQARNGFTHRLEWVKERLPRYETNQETLQQWLESDEWLTRETVGMWCDRILGGDVMAQIDRQMMKWCAAFCDEGEAAWAMPHREETFFRAWKASAQYDFSLACLGIGHAGDRIRRLSDRPEDVLLESLEQLQIPKMVWQEYLALHVAALPGWAGFIKWRAEQTSYPWQEAYRIDLVKYLAVRLFYERELVSVCFRKRLGSVGNVGAVREYGRRFPYACWIRRMLALGRVSDQARAEAARLSRWLKKHDAEAWEALGRRWYDDDRYAGGERSQLAHAGMIVRLADVLGVKPEHLSRTPIEDLRTLSDWLHGFPPRLESQKWLEAFELAHQQRILQTIHTLPTTAGEETQDRLLDAVRPLAQFVFCIDVRSEVFRRHLERQGGYETFGFAGFFGLPISYRSLDEAHEIDLCPVLLKPKHIVREVPRAHQGDTAQRRRTTATLAKAAKELLHDLKHNVVTPYVMVEAIGWFFAWPFIGKTLFPRWYHRVSVWFRRVVMPPVGTTLTVDKLTNADAHEMVSAEQRMQILRWLRNHDGIEGRSLTPEILEGIRLQALNADQESGGGSGPLAQLFGVSQSRENELLDMLIRECRLTSRDTAVRIDRLTRTGFTTTEQAYYVETSLRLMGLTSVFARLVFLCGHASTSQNNPYESALDCGACGGSQGLPNARAFAAMANRPEVRKILERRGLVIPPDTHFVAAVHDTTTDRLMVSDMEDVPPTHRKELARILEDLAATTHATTAERHMLLSNTEGTATSRSIIRSIERRSLDWAQVRPEWGLAGNCLFIVAGRRLTQGTDLGGRSFLHSYDHASDQDGKLLEIIMTAPLIVAQWINLEYYFSTVDSEVYGSGSKIYHNVTGGIGVMTGNQSDLRMGLPLQTVMNGSQPYHEPLRLTALIEAPRARVDAILARQPFLKNLFDRKWLRLIVLEPADRKWYRYQCAIGWVTIAVEEKGKTGAPVPALSASS